MQIRQDISNEETEGIASFLDSQEILYEGATTLFDQIEGGILQGRYEIRELLDEGSNGSVYRVVDQECQNKNLVVKIQPCDSLAMKEVDILLRMNGSAEAKGERSCSIC